MKNPKDMVGASKPRSREMPRLRPDRSAVANEVFGQLSAAAAAISTAAEGALEAEGLTLPQLHVLQVLRDAKAPGAFLHEVRKHLACRASSVTKLVDKLERRRLVRRSRSQSDRRTVRVTVTPAGLGLLEALEGPVDAGVAAALAPLSDEDLLRLRTLLSRLLDRTKD